MNITHRPVLLAEAVTALVSGPLITSPAASKNLLLIDGTFGRGGHTQALLAQLPANARMISFDKDLDAIAVAEKINDSRLRIVHDSFAQMDQYADPESVDGILLDLGISSPQVDEAHRGFSFRKDGPLDMRMNTDQGLTAAEWLEQASQEDITYVIKTYGEERFAFQIAKAIVAKREEGLSPKTTLQLAGLVAGVVRTREVGQDPATRTFQALRIFINRELEDLELGLKAALNLLKPGARLAVISFHSLEDRIVKQFLQSHAKVEVPRGLPVRDRDLPQSALEIIGRVKPSDEEVRENPRARSAIMRVAEKRTGVLA
ncbi:MAG: 16S rRNA (cytosine(1402)-N(4))-methyltransferase RsmH [Rhodoferax sp.]|uniref:16S rRNA (cytosine(1402)-N(4))-methyltransferase RsmH n=1 Tax=Polynucleobacter sp. MG-Unter2-18 TaxID=2081052 RepID=UPI001BFDD4CC|nr:16S rRNA (cytosine(1402)-N(4))-methyltransferase RsmH [Polynucleobacter sp. MG-Unter2-18]MCF8166176.1 16S rRNA (cytosine(1402)-N(4))-methyltransferase RsmH [Rhodoferax sp.]MCF8191168.1 16S rRNA (cytosine(1402)-N(4))-methyltransferase RsmH [Polynucleobacter sp.]QWD94732.1 16S rRNA (cytosine(1402)-N(4))-methyltransferase RsmH [Polynucleobacter sp. MG-Unter2-18]